MRWPAGLKPWKATPVFGVAFLFVALAVLSGCSPFYAAVVCAEYKCNPVKVWVQYQVESAEREAREKAGYVPKSSLPPPPTVEEEMASHSEAIDSRWSMLVPTGRPGTARMLIVTADTTEVGQRTAADNPEFTPAEAEQVAAYFTKKRRVTVDAAASSGLFTRVDSGERRAFVFPRPADTYVVRDLRTRFAYQLRADRKDARKTPDYTLERHGISRAALEEPESNFWCVDHPDWPTPRVVKQEPPFLFAVERTEFGGEGHGFLSVIRTMIDDHTRKHFLSMAAEDFNAMLDADSGFEPCPEVRKIPASL